MGILLSSPLTDERSGNCCLIRRLPERGGSALCGPHDTAGNRVHQQRIYSLYTSSLRIQHTDRGAVSLSDCAMHMHCVFLQGGVSMCTPPSL